jgi:hypothetical protein
VDYNGGPISIELTMKLATLKDNTRADQLAVVARS